MHRSPSKTKSGIQEGSNILEIEKPLGGKKMVLAKENIGLLPANVLIFLLLWLSSPSQIFCFSYIFHNNTDSCSSSSFFCLAKQELFETLKLDINQYSVWMCLFICSSLLADNSPDSLCSSRQPNYKPDQ